VTCGVGPERRLLRDSNTSGSGAKRNCQARALNVADDPQRSFSPDRATRFPALPARHVSKNQRTLPESFVSDTRTSSCDTPLACTSPPVDSTSISLGGASKRGSAEVPRSHDRGQQSQMPLLVRDFTRTDTTRLLRSSLSTTGRLSTTGKGHRWAFTGLPPPPSAAAAFPGPARGGRNDGVAAW
jgi:hypothetical protein